MGSTMKRSIFDDQTSKALVSWRKSAGKKKLTDTVKPKNLASATSPASSPTAPSHSAQRMDIPSVDIQKDPPVDKQPLSSPPSLI